jgi:hypothetical protein
LKDLRIQAVFLCLYSSAGTDFPIIIRGLVFQGVKNDIKEAVQAFLSYRNGFDFDVVDVRRPG